MATSPSAVNITLATTDAQPKGEAVVRVDGFAVQPVIVSPGQKLTLSGEYFVTTPSPNARIPVVESVIIGFYDNKGNQWTELGRTRNEINITPGTRRITPSEITVPEQPTARLYRLTFQVEHNSISDQKSQLVFVGTP
jgi:hypothetical protein